MTFCTYPRALVVMAANRWTRVLRNAQASTHDGQAQDSPDQQPERDKQQKWYKITEPQLIEDKIPRHTPAVH
jgi:polyferredoxin